MALNEATACARNAIGLRAVKVSPGPLSYRATFVSGHFRIGPLSYRATFVSGHFRIGPLSYRATFVSGHFRIGPLSYRATFVSGHFRIGPLSYRATFVSGHFRIGPLSYRGQWGPIGLGEVGGGQSMMCERKKRGELKICVEAFVLIEKKNNKGVIYKRTGK